jgi:hypothetical protein
MHCANVVWICIPITDSTSHNVHYVKSIQSYPQINGYIWFNLQVIHRNLWITVYKSLWTSRWPRQPGTVAATPPRWPPWRGRLLRYSTYIPNNPAKKKFYIVNGIHLP